MKRNVWLFLCVAVLVSATVAFAQGEGGDVEAEEFRLFGETWTDLHRAASHFPMGLLLSSVFFDVVGFVTRRVDLRATAFWTHLLGVLGAAVTLVLGLVANPFREETGWFPSPFAKIDNELAAKVVQHQWVGTVALVVFGLLALWRVLRKNRLNRWEQFFYNIATAAGVVAVGAAGYLGGHVMD